MRLAPPPSRSRPSTLCCAADSMPRSVRSTLLGLVERVRVAHRVDVAGGARARAPGVRNHVARDGGRLVHHDPGATGDLPVRGLGAAPRRARLRGRARRERAVHARRARRVPAPRGARRARVPRARFRGEHRHVRRRRGAAPGDRVALRGRRERSAGGVAGARGVGRRGGGRAARAVPAVSVLGPRAARELLQLAALARARPRAWAQAPRSTTEGARVRSAALAASGALGVVACFGKPTYAPFGRRKRWPSSRRGTRRKGAARGSRVRRGGRGGARGDDGAPRVDGRLACILQDLLRRRARRVPYMAGTSTS